MPSNRRVQVLSILGCCLMNVPNGTRWLWGNLTVYSSSYFYAQGGHDANEVNTPWTLSISMVAWSAGVLTSAFLAKYFGRHLALLFGNILFIAGLFLSYVSMNSNSITALNISYGVVTGFGNGITETMLVMVASDWAGRHKGLLISIVYSCPILGSVANNQLATWYINPQNLKPTLEVGASMFFTQPPVIERTPSFFLLYFFISAFFHTLGLVFICHQKADVKLKWRPNCHCCQNIVLAKTSPEKRRITSLDVKRISGEESLKTEEEESSNVEDMDVNMTPRQVILTTTFHAVWIGLSCSELAKVWLFDYYKIFGLRSVTDDHFLTNLGTLMSVTTALIRPCWGWSSDHIGMKPTLILLTAIVTFVTAFFFFTPFMNRWVYAFSTLVFGASVSGYSLVTMVVIVRMYGTTNYSLNYGMLCVAYVVTNLLAPLMYQGFLDRWGWFPLLSTLSVMNGFSMVVHMVLMKSNVR